MATKLYLHDAANAQSGDYPSDEQASVFPAARASGWDTIRTMNKDIGVSQASIATQDVDLIGSSSQVIWWAGPNEQVGYVIAYPVPTRNHPTQRGNIAEVGFKRSAAPNDQSLLDLINAMRREQSLSEFATLAEGLTWLDTIPYWYSYGK